MIVPVSERRDLAPVAARWIVDAFFGGPGGYTVEEMTAMILARQEAPAETFVLFDGRRPVGTAGLAHEDLDARPDLTPWLAGVFVEPEFRGRGHASALVRRVEACAQAARVGTLWLYTTKAEGLYLRLGWERVGIERDRNRDVVLMRKAFTAPPAARS